MVLRQNGLHRPAFPSRRGTTQGRLVSPTLFNVVVDNFIRTWLAMKVEYHRVARDGLGEIVGKCLGVFYTKNVMVGSPNSDWLQYAMKTQ